MRNLMLASALAVVLATSAHAGGFSGGPVTDPNQPPACDPDSGDVCDGGDGGDGTGGDTGTGGNQGGGNSGNTPIIYTHGTGAVLFTLDSLPTGAEGTQAFFQPTQNYTALGVGILPSTQGALHETVDGLTVAFHTADFIYGTSPAQTVIRTDNDGAMFGYEGVPAAVGVGIEASVASGGQPGAIYANFSHGLSDFSINLYRIVAPVDGSPTAVNATIYAYSGLNGTGTLLGSASGSADGGAGFAYTTIALDKLAGARSFVIQGGSGLANYDDITATAAVPESASWAMMLGGFGLLGGALRRRRASIRFA
jgi:hypothetical protein